MQLARRVRVVLATTSRVGRSSAWTKKERMGYLCVVHAKLRSRATQMCIFCRTDASAPRNVEPRRRPEIRTCCVHLKAEQRTPYNPDRECQPDRRGKSAVVGLAGLCTARTHSGGLVYTACTSVRVHSWYTPRTRRYTYTKPSLGGLVMYGLSLVAVIRQLLCRYNGLTLHSVYSLTKSGDQRKAVHIRSTKSWFGVRVPPCTRCVRAMSAFLYACMCTRMCIVRVTAGARQCKESGIGSFRWPIQRLPNGAFGYTGTCKCACTS